MASSESPRPTHLEASPLGTKEYWDNLYTAELTNHTLNPSDEGTIWFDDSAAEDKVISFLEKHILERGILGGLGKESCSFLDLGTGNGHLLFRLREGEDDEDDEDGEGGGVGDGASMGWNGKMLGVDYSLKSIEFAKRIADDKKLGPSSVEIPESNMKLVEFKWWDIMSQDPQGIVLEGTNADGWDVVLDKGTFDAISLSEEKDENGRRICEGYKGKVVPLIRERGVLLVTSCNWTEEELMAWFDGGELELVDKIEYKSFSFGGKKGQTISSVCFRKCGLR